MGAYYAKLFGSSSIRSADAESRLAILGRQSLCGAKASAFRSLILTPPPADPADISWVKSRAGTSRIRTGTCNS